MGSEWNTNHFPIYRANVSGVVSGDQLFVDVDPHAFREVQIRANPEAGDTIVVSGVLYENRSPNDKPYRDHSAPSSGDYRTGPPRTYATWQIGKISDIFVKDKKTGEWVIGEMEPPNFTMDQSIKKEREILYASPANSSVTNLVAEGKKMSFVGRITTGGHLSIQDAIDYLGPDVVPTITGDVPERVKSKSNPAAEDKKIAKRATFTVIEGGSNSCERSLLRAGAPALYIVK